MSQGTPEDYERAIAAEHQVLPREYTGRNGGLDIVATAENLLAFSDIIEGQPRQGADFENRTRVLVAVHEKRQAWHRATQKMSSMAWRALERIGEASQTPDGYPIVPILPF